MPRPFHLSIARHAGLACLNVAFFAAALGMAIAVPFDGAPDEWSHFHYNVEFLLTHHRLPVSGVDDLSAYQTGYPNAFGRVTCRYSYVVFPHLHTLLQAAGAAAAHAVSGCPPYLGARLVSVGFGLLFLNALYFAVHAGTRNRLAAVLAACAGAFIPQVVYTASYINDDIHSLAFSSLLLWSLARVREKPSGGNLVFMGVSIGLLLTAKYNYFVYFPFLLVVGVIALARRGMPAGMRARIVAAAVAIPILVSGFWFLRNAVLYHDPLGMAFFRRQMDVHQAPGVAQPLSLASLSWMLSHSGPDRLFQTFFGRFGYLAVGFPDHVYECLGWIVGLLAALFVFELILARDRPLLAGLGLLALAGAASLGLVTYNCLKWDFQPQGRYLFPLVAPAALLMGHAVARHGRLLKYVAGFCAAMLILLVKTFVLFAQVSPATPPITAPPLRAVPPASGLAEATGLVFVEVRGVALQPFTCPTNGLRGLRLQAGPLPGRRTTLYRLDLTASDSRGPVRRSYLLPQWVQSGASLDFAFKPIADSGGRTFTAVLVPEDGPVDPPLTLAGRTPSNPENKTVAGRDAPPQVEVMMELLY